MFYNYAISLNGFLEGVIFHFAKEFELLINQGYDPIYKDPTHHLVQNRATPLCEFLVEHKMPNNAYSVVLTSPSMSNTRFPSEHQIFDVFYHA